MEIRVLRYFLAVAKEQSISRAAQALHLSQPTLSRQLMDLETELGKQLMIRGTRRLTLTEEGVLLRKRAEEIIDLVDKTEAEIKAADDKISGDVLIGAGETDAMRLIAEVAKRLSDEYPDIHMHVFSGNAEEVTEKLDKGLRPADRAGERRQVRIYPTARDRYLGFAYEKGQPARRKGVRRDRGPVRPSAHMLEAGLFKSQRIL